MTQLSVKGAMALKILAVALAPSFAYVAAVAVGHFRVAVTTTFRAPDSLNRSCAKGLCACCDADDYLLGVVFCTASRVAASHDCVQHDLHAILDQEVGKVEAQGEFKERFPEVEQEHDLQEPGHRAQRTDDHDKYNHDMVRVIVEFQVSRPKCETERDPIQDPVDKLKGEHAL
tara:strand:- start:120 stop:638 length:519 start_codon:yes stop_codon:yes gene_type:complete